MPTRIDAISMLKADHEKVRGLLAQLEKSTERAANQRERLLAQIAAEVATHTTLEEEIFYPSYRDAVEKKEDRKLYQEALEEHHVVDLVMPEIEETDPSSEVFAAKAKVLKEIIEHHAEEEEKGMFKKARQVFEPAELRELAARMEARKAELQGEGEESEEDERGASAEEKEDDELEEDDEDLDEDDLDDEEDDEEEEEDEE
jgi:hemerythrin-like domain-containing protein